MTALINTILNKSSTYAEFAKSFVKYIPKGYRRVDIKAHCDLTSQLSAQDNCQLRGQSEKIHIASQGLI